MKRLAWLIWLLAGVPAMAQTGAIQGNCDLGGSQAAVSGMSSTNYQQGNIPHCRITVYETGTSTKAVIYADGNNTPLGNPFTANAASSPYSGHWIFWVSTTQGVDVVADEGDSPNTYPAAVTLCADCYASSQFTVVSGVTSLSADTPITVNGGAGPATGAVTAACADATNLAKGCSRPDGTTITATGGVLSAVPGTALNIETNGAANATQSLLNFTDSPTVSFTNPTGGAESASVPSASASSLGVAQCDGTTITCPAGVFTANVGNNLTMQVVPPIAGQFVAITAGTYVAQWDGVEVGPCYEQAITASSGSLACTGHSLESQGSTLTWSNYSLPSYVLPANVTAVYAVAVSSYTPGGGSGTFACTVGGSLLPAANTGYSQTSQLLSGITGSNIGTVSCAAGLGHSSAYGPAFMDVPLVELLVYYTGTAPPASSSIQVVPPLAYNPSTNILGADLSLYALVYSTSGTAVGLPKIVTGTTTLSAGTVTVTLTGSSIFSSSTSYVCTANDETATNAVQVTPTSSSSVTFTGTGTDTVGFICVGN